jgi:cell division protein FtsQ
MKVARKSRSRFVTEENILWTKPSRSFQKKKTAGFLARSLRWLLFAVLVSFGVYEAGSYFVEHVLYENPRYRLREVSVEVKDPSLRQQILAASGLLSGQNVLRVDLKTVEKRIEGLPFVARAVVERRLPDGIVIRIKERMPAAKFIVPGPRGSVREVLFLDREGVVIQPQDLGLARELPEIVGFRTSSWPAGSRIDDRQVLAALALLEALELSSLRARLDPMRVDVSRPLSLVVMTWQGCRISFRPDHFDQQLQRLEQILGFSQSRGRKLATVDLTLERNVPVTFQN